MRYIVLYAASCPSCSEVAQMVRNTSIPGLEARTFEDPQVTEKLTDAGLITPDRPSLLVISDGGVQILSGWAMRKRLAGVVGWRRSSTIARLLAAEWRARLGRSAVSYMPSRRGLIGSALAGVAAAAASSGAAGASTAPKEDAPVIKAVSPADAARVLETTSAQRAIRAWGPAESQVFEISGGSYPVFVLKHPEHEIYTFIDNSPGALRSGDPAAVSLGVAPTAGHALRYYTASGVALADVAVSDGRVTASPVQQSPGGPASDTEAVPDIKAWQIACFASCIGRKSGAPCILTCRSCFFDATGTLAKMIACTNCFFCAGPNGVPCLKECAII
jgi:hypothetical protein